MATISGTVKDAAGNGISRLVSAYLQDTGVLQAKGVSTAGSGAFSLTVPTTALHRVLCQDAIPDPTCVLMTHLDGVNAATVFTDDAGRTLTRTAATVSTAQSKFGGASALYTGTTSKLSISDQVNFQFGAAAFAIEMYFLPTGFPAAGLGFGLFAKGSAGRGGVNGGSFVVELYNDAGVYQLRFYIATTATGYTYLFSANYTPSLTEFTFLEFGRSGDTVYLFANGVLLLTGAVGTSVFYADASIPYIGAIASTTGNFKGYIDEVRVRKTACHTADYSAALPTTPFSYLIPSGKNALVFDSVMAL